MKEEHWQELTTNLQEKADNSSNENFKAAVAGVIENSSGRPEPLVAGSTGRSSASRGRVLSQVQKEVIPWLWPGHLTHGITIVYGLPGCGKSLFSAYYIAGLTRGDPNPDGTLRERGSAITVAFEDTLESTIVDRFERAGADMDRISDLTMVEKDDPYGGTLRKPFSLVTDQDELFGALTAMSASIAVLDPLSMLFDGISNYNNQKIGKCLWNLKVRAEQEGVCILLIGHPNKDGVTLAGGAQLERIARIIFHFSKDPTRKDVCVMKNTKNNLTYLQPPMAFSTADGKLEWIHGENPADQVLHEARRVGDLRAAMQTRIDEHPDTEFGARDFADLKDYTYNRARGKLQDMFAAGLVTNPAYGKYQSILCQKTGTQGVQVPQNTVPVAAVSTNGHQDVTTAETVALVGKGI